MRPVRKGNAYLYTNGQPHGMAKEGLIARIGSYCSYCERPLSHGWEVEHIQPKSIHVHLERDWSNFLLSCKNCNTCKGVKNLPLSDWLIPDRDNTFAGIEYLADGTVQAISHASTLASRTISTVCLDRKVDPVHDEQGVLIGIDRRTQRMNQWLLAERYRKYLESSQPEFLVNVIRDLALSSGFFSIWMKVFYEYPEIRLMLINSFPGTEGDCFDEQTMPTNAHPNTDGLSDGGKL